MIAAPMTPKVIPIPKINPILESLWIERTAARGTQMRIDPTTVAIAARNQFSLRRDLHSLQSGGLRGDLLFSVKISAYEVVAGAMHSQQELGNSRWPARNSAQSGKESAARSGGTYFPSSGAGASLSCASVQPLGVPGGSFGGL